MDGTVEFPASAANTLVEGYCNDFVQLSASLAQTLEQVSMRGLSIDSSRPSLERVERGMRDLADAIAGMLTTLEKHGSGRFPAAPPRPAPEPARAAPEPVRAAAPASAQSSATRTVPKPIPTAAASAQSPDCVIQGNTSSMPLTSVFQFLSRMRKTGILRITMGQEHMSLEIVEGCVEATATDRPSPAERIGELLVEKRFVRPDQLTSVLQGQRSTSQALGVALIRAKLITNGQLHEVLELQAIRRIQRAMTAKDASYAFLEGRMEPRYDHVRIRLPLHQAAGQIKK